MAVTQLATFAIASQLPLQQAYSLTSVFSAIVTLVLIALLYIQDNLITNQQKALRWFANHVKVDNKFKPDPIPEDLRDMVEVEEDDTPVK